MGAKYGKLTNGLIEYAPYTVTIDGVTRATGSLSPEEAAAFGWKRVVDVPPEAVEGYYATPSGWTEMADEIRRDYVIRPVPVTPRSWTPLSIKRACGDKWAAVKAALEAANIYEDFVMAQELVEDDAAFQQGYSWAVGAYGKDAVDAILAAAEGLK